MSEQRWPEPRPVSEAPKNSDVLLWSTNSKAWVYFTTGAGGINEKHYKWFLPMPPAPPTPLEPWEVAFDDYMKAMQFSLQVASLESRSKLASKPPRRSPNERGAGEQAA